MFHMSVSDVMTKIVGQVLPPLRAQRRQTMLGYNNFSDPGIYMNVDLALSHYTPEVTYGRRVRMHWLFCSHVSTFVAVEHDDERWFDAIRVPVEEWRNTSNHDSCWRSDGVDSFINKVYFAHCQELNKMLVEDGREQLRPIDFSQFCHFGLCDAWKEVLITHGPDDSVSGTNYWRKVLRVEPLESAE